MDVMSTADMFRAGVAAAKSGQDVSNAMGETEQSTLQTEDDDSSVSSFESKDYQSLGFDDEATNQEEGSESNAEGQADAPAESAESKTPEAKELVTITDDKGKRQVEVDFSDREKLKKYVQLAHGSRKWQAERDQERQAHQKTKELLASKDSDWNKLEEIWQRGGVEGLIDHLEGQGAYESRVAAGIKRQKELEAMSPAAREAALAKEAADRQTKELERIRSENESFRTKMAQEREQADISAMEAKVHPVFQKHAFAGKLGDSDAEEMFDEMLWSKANNRLEQYEEAGVTITPELIEREYSAVAKVLRSKLAAQGEKAAAKTIEKKKKEASETLQADLRSGYKPKSGNKELQEYLDKGDTKSILQNFSRLLGRN